MRRFKILGELGRGGFGRVLRVVEEGSDLAPELALKLLTGAWARSDDPARRLRDEARLMARLRHPGIVRLIAYLNLDSGPGLLMELVDGPNLAELLRRGGPVPARAALEIVACVAEALAYAAALPGDDGAALSLRHRDVKPANLAITRHGEVKLLDFGIAWGAFRAREAESGPEARGTGTYMAPERHAGRDSETVDVFSLGLVLLNLLTGKEHPELPSAEADQRAFQDRLGLTALAALGPRSRVNELIAALVISAVEWSPVARPSPEKVAELARVLAAEAGGPGLREWAASAVPPVEAAVAEAAGVGVVGAVLSEVAGEAVLSRAAVVVAVGVGSEAITADEGDHSSGDWLPGEAPPGVHGTDLLWPDAAGAAFDRVTLVPAQGPEAVAVASGRRRWAAGVAALALALLVGGTVIWPAPGQNLDDSAVIQTDAAPKAPAEHVAPLASALVQPALAAEPVRELAPPAPLPATPRMRSVDVRATPGPADQTGHVHLEGDATRVELLTSGEPIALPADVAPGTYRVLVTFPNGDRPFINGELTVAGGASYEIRCLFAMLNCRTRELR